MKFCSSCATVAEDDVLDCAKCGRSFPSASSESSATLTAREEALRIMPDGAIPRTIGWILIGVSVLLALWSGLMPVTTYSFSTDIDPDKLATKALLALCAEGAFALGLVLWLAGYIVHAISFLPGKEDANAAD